MAVVFITCLLLGTAFRVLHAAELAGGKVPLPPGAAFDSRGTAADGLDWENYKTTRGGTAKFYQKALSKDGWTLVKPLGPEDATDCGGDWGGMYARGDLKFKLHVCGFDQDNAYTNIDFKFFWKVPDNH